MWRLLTEFWPLFATLLYLGLAITATIHIVLWKRDSRAAIGWVGLAWLVPYVGAAIYYCFGINRIHRKAIALQARSSWKPRQSPELTDDEIQHGEDLARRYPRLVSLAAVGQKLTGHALLTGNLVETLINGDDAYPAMLDAIDNAEHSVALLSYIFDSDRAGDAFFEALVRAKKRGVEVRVLVDDVGSRYSRRNMVSRLRDAGVPAASFLPTRVPRLFKYANLRNHRKILVVDGRIGFTGGTNIRDDHWFKLEPEYPVQCVHFRLDGPIVHQLQEVFALDWAFASGESLSGEHWFPDLERVGATWARGIPDGPDEDYEKMSDTLLGALASATDQVLIVTPYFLPEASLVSALCVTAMRGVDVRIYMPAKVNIPIVAWAATAQFDRLLEKGCRLFLTPPPFDHSKLLVVDRAWSLIGSTNWDPRSLALNFEFNVECYDDDFSGRLADLIEHKAENAQEVTMESLESRSLAVRLRDGVARLATPYL